MELILATRNRGKIAEISQHLAGLDVNIRSLLDLPEPIEIVERGCSYSENALMKAMTVHQATGAMALADDSGLEIDALHGQPGVHSARYGGPDLSDEERNALVLKQLSGVPHQERGARFVCVAALVDEKGQAVEFRGTLEGFIGQESRGEEGFGYDPIFHPSLTHGSGAGQKPGVNRTVLHDKHSGLSLAQLGLEVKNRISHRAQAMQQVRCFLAGE